MLNKSTAGFAGQTCRVPAAPKFPPFLQFPVVGAIVLSFVPRTIRTGTWTQLRARPRSCDPCNTESGCPGSSMPINLFRVFPRRGSGPVKPTAESRQTHPSPASPILSSHARSSVNIPPGLSAAASFAGRSFNNFSGSIPISLLSLSHPSAQAAALSLVPHYTHQKFVRLRRPNGPHAVNLSALLTIRRLRLGFFTKAPDVTSCLCLPSLIHASRRFFRSAHFAYP